MGGENLRDLQLMGVNQKSFDSSHWGGTESQDTTSTAEEMSMVILETARLILRQLALADLDAMATLYADPEFSRFFGGPGSRAEAQADIEAFIAEYDTIGYGFYATLYKPENRFIGRCGLLTQWIEGTKEMEVAYGLAPAYWGRGLATEAAQAIKDYAFARFDVPRLISIVDEQNVASQRVAEKNGMNHEKTILFDGHLCRLYVVYREAGGGS
jgi:[ribosomal protein S5]-alanine N-acetyltransferase